MSLTAAPAEPAGGPADPAVLTGSAEVTTAATDAVRAASQAGADEVTVVAVDVRGRPTLVDAPLADAVDVALATAESLDVVAVEVPSYATALEETGGATESAPDPLEGQQWAMAKYPFSALWPCGRAAGITVAVVDTGVQADHPDLAGRVLAGAAIQSGAVQLGAGNIDVNGHGTHVAGIIGAGANEVGIVGVAPDVTILPVRVLDMNGSGPNSDIGKGITWAVDNGASVINISIGSDVNSAAVSTAVSYATRKGTLVVAAAGNNHNQVPADAPQYPAALADTVAVSAFGQSGAIAGYSTNGAYVDVAAPGSGILSSIPTSRWGNKSGTSMAAPHITALVALIIDARGAVAPAAMLTRLTSTATDAGQPGFDQAFGWGRVDPVAAVNAP